MFKTRFLLLDGGLFGYFTPKRIYLHSLSDSPFKSLVIRPKGESQNGCTLFSCNTRFEICPLPYYRRNVENLFLPFPYLQPRKFQIPKKFVQTKFETYFWPFCSIGQQYSYSKIIQIPRRRNSKNFQIL